jgi:hypothetical protein
LKVHQNLLTFYTIRTICHETRWVPNMIWNCPVESLFERVGWIHQRLFLIFWLCISSKHSWTKQPIRTTSISALNAGGSNHRSEIERKLNCNVSTAPSGVGAHNSSRNAHWLTSSTPLVVKWQTTYNIGKAATYSTTSSFPPFSVDTTFNCCNDRYIRNYCKPTPYTYALYLTSGLNIAPTNFCWNGNVMYNNKAHFFA